MCRPKERTHKHHIIPKYMGGSEEPENLVEVTVTQHAMFHFCNYQLWGNEEDKLAWRGLSGQIGFDEARLELYRLNGKRSGQKTYEDGTGIFAMAPEEQIEVRRKAGKIAGRQAYENKTGIHGLSIEEQKKVAKQGGQRAKELKVGVHARTKEEMAEHGRRGAKAVHSQRWQCTVTGHESTPCGLSKYQNRRGIDTSNRIRIK